MMILFWYKRNSASKLVTFSDQKDICINRILKRSTWRSFNHGISSYWGDEKNSAWYKKDPIQIIQTIPESNDSNTRL